MTSLQVLELAAALGVFVLLIALLRRVGIGQERLPYFSKEFLLSRGESAFYQTLRKAAPNNLMICPKVRMGDLLGCSAEGWKTGYGSKISQKHVDFVLADTETTAIILAIELDDQTHKRPDRQERDLFLDRAMQTCGIPILRVTAAATYDQRAVQTQIDEAIHATAGTVKNAARR